MLFFMWLFIQSLQKWLEEAKGTALLTAAGYALLGFSVLGFQTSSFGKALPGGAAIAGVVLVEIESLFRLVGEFRRDRMVDSGAIHEEQGERVSLQPRRIVLALLLFVGMVVLGGLTINRWKAYAIYNIVVGVMGMACCAWSLLGAGKRHPGESHRS